MTTNDLSLSSIDYIEIYTPMAKALAFWHTSALGFRVEGYLETSSGGTVICSYLLVSQTVRLVLTSTFPSGSALISNEVSSFVLNNHCGVKRVAISVASVEDAFDLALSNGGIPVFPTRLLKDDKGIVLEAAIRLYNDSEILFIDRSKYHGNFKPGFLSTTPGKELSFQPLTAIDHIASEVNLNERILWSNYLSKVLGLEIVQQVSHGSDNLSGILLNIHQSSTKSLTFVIAEPDGYDRKSKIQQNMEKFGSGIHHLAFCTDNIFETTKYLFERNVEFITFPKSYYDLLRSNTDFDSFDIDSLQEFGVLIDKEDDSYLLQKFIKPIGDRPFFLYELVQRVNGYNGFALRNINVLKRAEQLELMM